MQLYAWSEEQTLIEAEEAEKQRDYSCMECGGVVRVRRGEQRRSHFYHYRESPGCRQAGKSLEHIQTQLFISKWVNGTTALERPFPSVNRIADVVWEEPKIIFEVQCSPILAEEVRARNADYARCGYRVIWILHDSRYGQRRMTSAEHFLQKSPHYYTNIDAEGSGILYDKVRGVEDLIAEFKCAVIPLKRFTSVASPLRIRAAHWPFRFEGDLFDRLDPEPHLFGKRLWKRCCLFYRGLLQMALESSSG